MNRFLLYALALLLGGSLLAACGAREATTDERPQLTVALLDVSGSTEALRDQYLAQFERILAGLKPGGRLLVLPVFARSLLAAPVADITIPTASWWKTNSFTHGRTVTRLRKEALEAVSTLLRESPEPNGTALVDSLLQVQEYLKPYPEESGALYIISDMIEQSDLLDLYGLDDAGIEPALARVEEANRLPALRGAAVTVAGLEASADLPTAQVLAVKRFWERLFERAGAILLWYSPTLQLPEALPQPESISQSATDLTRERFPASIGSV